jgi:hypothetical protein
MTRVRSISEVAALLADPTPEALGPLGGEALVVVKLDGRDYTQFGAVLRQRPCVAVGLHRSGTALPVGVDDFDVLLTEEPDPPRPWVPDRGEPLTRLAARVQGNPNAAVALVQLLRLSEGLSVVDALVGESFVYSMLQAGPEFGRWLAARRIPRPVHDGEPVHTARSGNRLMVSLNRPSVHNAYSAAMRDALSAALSIAVADPGLEKVHLRGEGPSFCSGGDLTEFGTTPDPSTAHFIRVTRSPARLLAELADRVVVSLHGACVGAGVELSAFASRVEAVSETWFELPEVQMGLVPGAGGTVSVPRRIGRHRTAVLALSGDRISAQQALDWGLIDKIVQP